MHSQIEPEARTAVHEAPVSTHTSGEWFAARSGDCIEVGNGRVTICRLYPVDSELPTSEPELGSETEANAELIAAAPALLKAASDLLAAIGGNTPDWLRTEAAALQTAVTKAGG